MCLLLYSRVRDGHFFMAEVLPYGNISVWGETDSRADLSHHFSQHAIIHGMGQRQWHQLVLLRLQIQQIDWIRRKKFTCFSFFGPFLPKRQMLMIMILYLVYSNLSSTCQELPLHQTFLSSVPSQASKTDCEALRALLWKLPPAQKIKGLDSHVYLRSHTLW